MREIIGDHLFGQSSTQVTEGLGNSLVSALLWRSLFGYVMMCCCSKGRCCNRLSRGGRSALTHRVLALSIAVVAVALWLRMAAAWLRVAVLLLAARSFCWACARKRQFWLSVCENFIRMRKRTGDQFHGQPLDNHRCGLCLKWVCSAAIRLCTSTFAACWCMLLVGGGGVFDWD